MTSMLGMCFNWKVLVGLGAVAVTLFAVAPGYALAALPLLLFAACPLSMVAMMFAMKGGMGAMRGHKEETSPESSEVLRARLAALREEELELERRLSQPAAPLEVPAPSVRAAASSPESAR